MTLENKTPAETFPKFLPVLCVTDRSDRNPPITATSVTFTPSLRHAKRAVIGEFRSDLLITCVTFTPSLRHTKRAVIGEFRSDLLITCMIDGNFGNVFMGVLFSKVAYQGKRW